MRDLLSLPMLSSLEEQIKRCNALINAAKIVDLVAPSDLEGVLGLVQIESALIDEKISYRRRLLLARRDVPRDEVDLLPDTDGLLIHIDPFAQPGDGLSLGKNSIHITPFATIIEFEGSATSHQGVVDCVALCAALANRLCTSSPRVRRLRPLSMAGQWLRDSLDATYDPALTLLRNHLDEEGSIQVVALPEVTNPDLSSLDGIAERMLKRLVKSWPEMDFDQRSQALSELALPVLREAKISTPRVEELIWKRAIIAENGRDLASVLNEVRGEWPEGGDKTRVHASEISDRLISTGIF
jgi:hypothetical protein|tara:strand:+ start:687 stop:1580 length:894 start_codon:yes stop_codon:yes gene_type:complete